MLRRLPMTSGARAARWSGPALRSQRAKNVEKRGEKWGKTHGKSTENHRKRQKTHRKPQKTHRRLIKNLGKPHGFPIEKSIENQEKRTTENLRWTWWEKPGDSIGGPCFGYLCHVFSWCWSCFIERNAVDVHGWKSKWLPGEFPYLNQVRNWWWDEYWDELWWFNDDWMVI